MTEQPGAAGNSSLFTVVVDKAQLQATIDVIRKKSQGNCLIATKVEGAKIRVEAVLYAVQPGTGMAEQIVADLKDKAVNVHEYAEGKAEAEIDF